MYLQRCIATGLLAIAVAGSPVASAAYPVESHFLIYPGHVLSPTPGGATSRKGPTSLCYHAADTATSASSGEPDGFGHPFPPKP